MRKGLGVFFIIVFILTSTVCYVSGDNKNELTKKEKVNLYFSDKETLNLLSIKTEVTYDGNSIEKKIVEKLKKDSKDKKYDYIRTIGPDITLLSLETRDGTAYVNFSSENLNGGSAEETLMIDSIVLSLTELKHISKVQFLIDGEIEESLMGHISIKEPFDREDVTSKYKSIKN
ncbi:GerMN domain-containing protein [Dethiothermospora halolimnae]|uniref:GerMN domain-containing protein n=1 Tax=Dethiothermospora halolimnae TaxID=3114390 RepID=UPI003CCBD00E